MSNETMYAGEESNCFVFLTGNLIQADDLIDLYAPELAFHEADNESLPSIHYSVANVNLLIQHRIPFYLEVFHDEAPSKELEVEFIEHGDRWYPDYAPYAETYDVAIYSGGQKEYQSLTTDEVLARLRLSVVTTTILVRHVLDAQDVEKLESRGFVRDYSTSSVNFVKVM